MGGGDACDPFPAQGPFGWGVKFFGTQSGGESNETERSEEK